MALQKEPAFPGRAEGCLCSSAATDRDSATGGAAQWYPSLLKSRDGLNIAVWPQFLFRPSTARAEWELSLQTSSAAALPLL